MSSRSSSRRASTWTRNRGARRSRARTRSTKPPTGARSKKNDRRRCHCHPSGCGGNGKASNALPEGARSSCSGNRGSTAPEYSECFCEKGRLPLSTMSDPILGLTMLGLIVIAIMMGFPTAFTLMGLGMLFGYLAFWSPGQHWYDNRIFDLIVQRTYGVMTNDTLLSIPLFVYMGYIMERAALIDQMFHSVQVAFRRVPASLAVTTMLVCAFWGIASGIVGAVVIL